MREQPKERWAPLSMLRRVSNHEYVEGGPSKSWMASEVLRLSAENRGLRKGLREIVRLAGWTTSSQLEDMATEALKPAPKRRKAALKSSAD